MPFLSTLNMFVVRVLTLFFLVPQSQKQHLDRVVRTLVFHGTTPPYIYGPSRAKTKWNGSATGSFIIYRPNSHENIGRFDPNPKNGMLPSNISLDFPRNYGPFRGQHPSPSIFCIPCPGIVRGGHTSQLFGHFGVRGVVVVPRHKSQAVGSSKVELGFPNIGGDDGDKIGAARSPSDKTPQARMTKQGKNHHDLFSWQSIAKSSDKLMAT